MGIPVTRCKRNKIMSDPDSQVLNYLKLYPGQSRMYYIEDIAAETEALGGMSAEDVTHVTKSFIRSLKKILVKGDKAKIDGLGTFYITFNCEGTEEEKDCTVRNIKKVNVRFKVDNTLRLVNDSIATTRGGANNVEFYIKSDSATTGSNPGNSDDDDDFIDPEA